MANREMETTGHYYEQRFGSREIFDDGSHLCNHGYVDLNQYRAGMAESLEVSTCSGIHDRLQAWRQQEIRESLAAFHGSVPKGYELESSQVERLLADCFLSPISDQGPGLLVPELKIVYEPKVLIYYSGPPVVSSGSGNNAIILNVPEEVEEEELAGDEADQSPTEPTTPSEPPVADSASSRGVPRKRRPKITRQRHRRLQKRRRRRASDVPILAIPLKQYLDLMQGTVERLNAHSLEPEPDSTVPLDLEAKGDSSSWAALAKYGIDPACWCELVGHCGDWSHRGVGAPEKIALRPAAGGLKSPSGSKTAGAGFT